MTEGDVSLTCIGCGGEFLFSKRDRAYFEEHEYSTPVRCKPCRQKRKRELEATGDSDTPAANERPTSPPPASTGTVVVCAGCGSNTTVPFVPRNDRPIYCRQCWLKRKRPAANPAQL